MKYLWIIILCLVVTSSFGQGVTLLEKKTVLIKGVDSNSYVYEVTVKRTSNGSFETTINYAGNDTAKAHHQTFEVRPLRQKVFEDLFVSAINAIGIEDTKAVLKTNNESNIRLVATNIYHSIVSLNSLAPKEQKGPKAGEFIINPKVLVYATNFNNSSRINHQKPDKPTTEKLSEIENEVIQLEKKFTGEENPKIVLLEGGKFMVKEVDIVIYNGFINEVIATVLVDTKEYRFVNPVPIGITSLSNINAFDKYYLRYNNPNNVSVKHAFDLVINLKDLLLYKPNEARNVFDRSPRNATHKIEMNIDKQKTYEVFKEPVSKLIQAAVFSDFVGLEETSPNGLIQTTIYRRMNLNTVRHQIFGLKRLNWGIFQYLLPELTVSKIEDKERVLPLNYLTTNINGIERQHAYVSTIDLHRHQYLRTGSLFNIALFQNPDLHTTVEFNAGGYFGFVALEDTMKLNPARSIETNQYTIATIEAFLEMKYEFSRDEYFGFDIGYTPFFLANLGNYQMQVKDNTTFANTATLDSFLDRALLGQIELLAWVKPAPQKSDGRLFARYRLIHQMSNINLYYQQIQIGYSFYFDIPRPKS